VSRYIRNRYAYCQIGNASFSRGASYRNTMGKGIRTHTDTFGCGHEIARLLSDRSTGCPSFSRISIRPFGRSYGAVRGKAYFPDGHYHGEKDLAIIDGHPSQAVNANLTSKGLERAMAVFADGDVSCQRSQVDMNFRSSKLDLGGLTSVKLNRKTKQSV
jgi:hypothetical protein